MQVLGHVPLTRIATLLQHGRKGKRWSQNHRVIHVVLVSHGMVMHGDDSFFVVMVSTNWVKTTAAKTGGICLLAVDPSRKHTNNKHNRLSFFLQHIHISRVLGQQRSREALL